MRSSLEDVDQDVGWELAASAVAPPLDEAIDVGVNRRSSYIDNNSNISNIDNNNDSEPSNLFHNELQHSSTTAVSGQLPRLQPSLLSPTPQWSGLHVGQPLWLLTHAESMQASGINGGSNNSNGGGGMLLSNMSSFPPLPSPPLSIESPFSQQFASASGAGAFKAADNFGQQWQQQQQLQQQQQSHQQYSSSVTSPQRTATSAVSLLLHPPISSFQPVPFVHSLPHVQSPPLQPQLLSFSQQPPAQLPNEVAWWQGPEPQTTPDLQLQQQLNSPPSQLQLQQQSQQPPQTQPSLPLPFHSPELPLSPQPQPQPQLQPPHLPSAGLVKLPRKSKHEMARPKTALMSARKNLTSSLQAAVAAAPSASSTTPTSPVSLPLFAALHKKKKVPIPLSPTSRAQNQEHKAFLARQARQRKKEYTNLLEERIAQHEQLLQLMYSPPDASIMPPDQLTAHVKAEVARILALPRLILVQGPSTTPVATDNIDQSTMSMFAPPSSPPPPPVVKQRRRRKKSVARSTQTIHAAAANPPKSRLLSASQAASVPSAMDRMAISPQRNSLEVTLFAQQQPQSKQQPPQQPTTPLHQHQLQPPPPLAPIQSFARLNSNSQQLDPFGWGFSDSVEQSLSPPSNAVTSSVRSQLQPASQQQQQTQPQPSRPSAPLPIIRPSSAQQLSLTYDSPRPRMTSAPSVQLTHAQVDVGGGEWTHTYAQQPLSAAAAGSSRVRSRASTPLEECASPNKKGRKENRSQSSGASVSSHGHFDQLPPAAIRFVPSALLQPTHVMRQVSEQMPDLSHLAMSTPTPTSQQQHTSTSVSRGGEHFQWIHPQQQLQPRSSLQQSQQHSHVGDFAPSHLPPRSPRAHSIATTVAAPLFSSSSFSSSFLPFTSTATTLPLLTPSAVPRFSSSYSSAVSVGGSHSHQLQDATPAHLNSIFSTPHNQADSSLG